MRLNKRGLCIFPMLLLLGGCAGDAATRATVSLAELCRSVGVVSLQLAPKIADGSLSTSQVETVVKMRDMTRPFCAPDSRVDPAVATKFVQEGVAQLRKLTGDN